MLAQSLLQSPQSRTRAKLCGIRTLAHAQVAVAAGADALGLVFYPPSPRALSLPAARAIVAALPPYIQLIGLFVNASLAEIAHAQTTVGFHSVQLHGDETPDLGQALSEKGISFYRAIRVGPATDLLECQQVWQAAGASALLLDTLASTGYGGTGECFDWQQIPPVEQRLLPFILSGGLTVANVGQAIQTVRPYAVDVSSGIERIKGEKDPALIRAFMKAVHHADV